MPRLVRAALPLLLLMALSGSGQGQGQAQKHPAVGIIDVYGLHAVPEAQVRKQLGFTSGDPLPAKRVDVEKRLAKIRGVSRATLTAVCCDDRKSIVFVGIEERDGPSLTFNPAPLGPARLEPDVIANGEALDRARETANRRSDGGEDVSQGHSLMTNAAARVLQTRNIGFAKRDLAQLKEVLKTSSDAHHRAIAADVLGYAADKKAVVPDLLAAMRDPAAEVRISAMRALTPIALLGQRSPDLGISVPPSAFVNLLSSPVWTDRSRASKMLVQLTQTRDSAVIRALRDRAVPSLKEMAKWKTAEYAQPSFWVLGRAVGVPDDSIQAAWMRGDRDAVIKAAK
jgi:hypothetical protein